MKKFNSFIRAFVGSVFTLSAIVILVTVMCYALSWSRDMLMLATEVMLWLIAISLIYAYYRLWTLGKAVRRCRHQWAAKWVYEFEVFGLHLGARHRIKYCKSCGIEVPYR